MRIAQVAPYFFPHIGGVESHVMALAEKLVERGHEVEVITSMHQKGMPEEEEMEGYKIKRIPTFVNLFSTPVTPKLRDYIEKSDFDVVHAHVPPPMSAYFAAKGCTATKGNKKPLVLTYHCDLEIPIPLLGPLIIDIYDAILGRYTLANSDCIIATTETYAATSRSVWNANTVVIPNAVDCKRFNPSVDPKNVRKRFGLENSNVVLYVGRLVHHKGLEYLIDSAKFGDKGTKYLIVGDGPMRQKFEDRVRKLRIQHRVLFIGKVSNKDLPYYFSACDLFVLPSVSRLEAFGLVALEAMATQKPVVVSNIPGVREVITEGVEGLHAEPMNPKDIAEKIKTILRDKELSAKMGLAGRKKVEEKFRWESVAQEIEKIYKGLIEEKGKEAKLEKEKSSS